jgi:putative Mg2+ transporter-C (MgtC) family protein
MDEFSMHGQGLLQLEELGLAFVLSALIGIEREMRHKSAGLRTYTLVGLSAAFIMVISKYGFDNVLRPDLVVLDPSRIAAQIVTGIGFIGGGLIFVRRDAVRGLTTAAIVWLTAAIGMACGAGLMLLAVVVTGAHFVIVLGFPLLARRLPRSQWAPSVLEVTFVGDSNVLQDVLIACTQFEFAVSRFDVQNEGVEGDGTDTESRPGGKAILEVRGTKSIAKLAARLVSIPRVVSVTAGDVNVISD